MSCCISALLVIRSLRAFSFVPTDFCNEHISVLQTCVSERSRPGIPVHKIETSPRDCRVRSAHPTQSAAKNSRRYSSFRTRWTCKAEMHSCSRNTASTFPFFFCLCRSGHKRITKLLHILNTRIKVYVSEKVSQGIDGRRWEVTQQEWSCDWRQTSSSSSLV
jgi:hypothetical protein